MFTNLLESARRSERRTAQGLLSLALHLGLGVGAVEASRRVAVPLPDGPRADTTIYAVPPPPPVAPSAEAVVSIPGPAALPEAPVQVSVPVDIPVGIPPVESGPAIDPSRFVLGPPRSPAACADCAAPAAGTATLFTEATVEQPVEILEQPSPRYPPVLEAAGITGRAVVRFVVDTLGRVEPGSAVAVEADHPAFGASAVTAIERSRFRPARLGGRAVRQLVLQSVRFRAR